MSEFGGGPKVGHKMHFYRNEGTRETPEWEEIDEIGDVTLDGLEFTTAELKRRSNIWTKELGAMIGAFTLSFRYIHGLGADIFDSLRADWIANTVREYAICDLEIDDDDVQGWRFAGLIKAFPWDQPLEDVSGHDFTLCHGYLVEDDEELDPEWMEGSSS